jgi:hypothetical protein
MAMGIQKIVKSKAFAAVARPAVKVSDMRIAFRTHEVLGL